MLAQWHLDSQWLEQKENNQQNMLLINKSNQVKK